jgi:hypothetical protein
MTHWRSVVLSVGVVACGDGGGGAVVPDAPVADASDAPAPEPPDAAPDAPPAPGTVTIQTIAEPALVAFRDDGSASWQSFPVAGKTAFEIHPTGPYRVVVVCRTPRSANASMFGRVLEDGATIERACGEPTLPLTVRGSLAATGSVTLGEASAMSSTAPWMFELALAAGIYDLAILVGDPFDPARIAMRRDVHVAADLDLGALDPTGAEPLSSVSFTATNRADGEVLTHYTSFDSGQGAFNSFVHDGSWTARFVPPHVLRPTDQQAIELGAYTLDGAHRSLYRGVGRAYHDGDPTEVTLPAAGAPVEFQVDGERLSVALPAMPAAAEATLATQTQVSGADRFRVQTTQLSSKFVHATGATSIVVDFTGVPGFLTDWKLADTGLRLRSFDSTVQTGPDDHTVTGVSETLGVLTLAGQRELASLPYLRHAQRASE